MRKLSVVNLKRLSNGFWGAGSSSATNSSLPFSFSSTRNAVSAPIGEDEFPRESPGVSYGLNWALAGRGVIVTDKAFQNLMPSDLQQKGATVAELSSGLPVLVRGNIIGGSSEISKAQFSKLLKQVTTHISSISDIFVHDGAIGLSPKCDAKVRIISDGPSAVLSLSSTLWRTSTRAVSHDSCPLTIYVATSISPSAGAIVGLGAQGNNGFIAADVERSSLILCGQAFTDSKGTKEALAALSGPIMFSRGGLPLSARLLLVGDSVILLFVPEDTVQSCLDLLVSWDIGVVLSSQGVSPLFQSGSSGGSYLPKLPAAVILASSDSSGTIPSVSQLSPGQAAYHFLAGYQNGKFLPVYSKGPSSVDPLELAKAFLSKIKDNRISCFLINLSEGRKQITGQDLIKLVQSTLSNNIPPFEPKGGDLQGRYKRFLSSKFHKLPKEFAF
ncbi:Phosphoenolpyruvate carboxykinase [Actinidia chinensis var. chinensis]|uniref:phosphoenolpyruvate carboxykinase (ATP) n=1 Tax=Actinidia chinensis var. chinensis TaxID=1590841 RepID=A0A2R6Q9J0_ACTCC|nr:Phosphoenolpyruvate carboxykinase [Actinidia chinensis var. chinensis]